MEQYKTCNKCKQTKPITEFYKTKESPDGHRARCKQCIKQQDADRYQKNKSRNQERSLNYYHRNKERAAKRSAERYAKNKEAISAKRKQKRLDNIWHYKQLERASYQRNKEQKRASAREYTRNNLDKSRERNSRRRARLASASVYRVTAKDLKKLYSSLCTFCGSSNRIDIDHVIPLSRGGNHSLGNLMPLCDNCNSTKYNKTIMEWRLYRIRIGNPLPLDKGTKL